ncbi:MAG: DUF2283 domain-containing protein [Candidatus Magasanikbacteria bacterium]|nr:DUF2283 domain-containing protein [Candidatus Magasanikbacteria bacterium]
MHYDIESNILSWEVAKGKISHAREYGNIIIHFSPAGKPILIEILEASKFVGQLDKLKELSTIKKIEEIIPAN